MLFYLAAPPAAVGLALTGRASRRRWLRRVGRIASALGCVLAGMVLFIGTSYCSRYWRASRETDLNTRWFSYTDVRAQFGFLG